MKRLVFFLLAIFALTQISAQSDFSLEIAPFEIQNLPAIHSYAFAQHDGKWLIIGGITGEDAFSSAPNYELLVIDPVKAMFWSYPFEYAALDIEEPEHLAACFSASQQVGDYLYLAGGMGYLTEAEAFGTFPYLTRIEVPALIDAIIKKGKINHAFQQMESEDFRVMDATLVVVDSKFFLAGGRKLTGTFNEQGDLKVDETFSRTFTVFTFSKEEDFKILETKVMDYDQSFQSEYPMAVAQIFPDGQQGLTMFYNEKLEDINKLSWMNIFDFGYSTYTKPEAELQQYHSTVIPVYDPEHNKMHTVFLGGCDDYLCSDEATYAPAFVEEMTRFTRAEDGSVKIKNTAIQTYLAKGKDALFLPVSSNNNGIINLDDLKDDRNLIGYIYGGATTPSPMFYTNGELLDSASNQLFKVYLNKNESVESFGVYFPNETMPTYRIQIPGHHK